MKLSSTTPPTPAIGRCSNVRSSLHKTVIYTIPWSCETVRQRSGTMTAMPILMMMLMQRLKSLLRVSPRIRLRMPSMERRSQGTPWNSPVKPSLVASLSHAFQCVGGLSSGKVAKLIRVTCALCIPRPFSRGMKGDLKNEKARTLEDAKRKLAEQGP